MQVPLATMMEEGQEGWGGRREESRLASGVVWKVAPESAIQSELTGGVLAVVLKEEAKVGGTQPTSPGESPERTGLATPEPPAPATPAVAAMLLAAPGRWPNGGGGGDGVDGRG
jgi:hypothetical protein